LPGHVRPTAGRVVLRGTDVTDTPPEARRVGIVFQRSTLYPHMTVEENVTYGLAAQDIGPNRRNELVSEYLGLVDLRGQRNAYPEELSGGQRRRVELARALAPQPDVLLLDEPLSALDRALREQLRDEIGRIQRETGVTTLFVTHDQEESMALADRLVVMNDGAVAGIGTPRALYESPPTPFIASFLGRSNTFEGTVVGRNPTRIDTVSDGTVIVTETDGAYPEGESITCHVRPDALSIRPSESADSNAADTGLSLTGRVANVIDLGRRYDITVRTESNVELVVESTESPPEVGTKVVVTAMERELTTFGP